MTEDELTVRAHVRHANSLPNVWVEMADDTDGPVTRVIKLVSEEDAQSVYWIGQRFVLRPIADPTTEGEI